MPKKVSSRPALSLAPTVLRIEDGHDAYVNRGTLRQLVKAGAGRWWSFHDMPTTVELPGKRYAKSIQGFVDHMDDAPRFLDLIAEYRDAGCPRPTGYADVFHKHFRSPRVAWSVNARLAPVLAGGWQQALRPGVHAGRFFKYDIRSAYLWAGSLGMPDVKTYRRSTRIRPDESGVYRVKLVAPVPSAPYPFNQAMECLATTEEIETYSLPVAAVVEGVTWRGLVDPAPMLDAVRKVSTWKAAGRSYWGRWGQTTQVSCHAGGRQWVLPNPAANVPWAAAIVSRVKMKAWEFSSDALHVFVDSLITPHALPVGEGIGAWKLEKVYEAGVYVKGPGQYGDLRERRMERYAGAPKNSPLRDLWAERNPELLAS